MDYKNFSWHYISRILVLISAFVVVSFNNSYGQLLKVGLEELTKNSHTVIKGNVSGIYIYKIQVNNFISSKKMLLVK